jgi:hypothetical protein
VPPSLLPGPHNRKPKAGDINPALSADETMKLLAGLTVADWDKLRWPSPPPDGWLAQLGPAQVSDRLTAVPLLLLGGSALPLAARRKENTARAEKELREKALALPEAEALRVAHRKHWGRLHERQAAADKITALEDEAKAYIGNGHDLDAADLALRMATAEKHHHLLERMIPGLQAELATKRLHFLAAAREVITAMVATATRAAEEASGRYAEFQAATTPQPAAPALVLSDFVLAAAHAADVGALRGRPEALAEELLRPPADLPPLPGGLVAPPDVLPHASQRHPVGPTFPTSGAIE